jgi:large subunit ribosomal protein L17
MRHRKLGRVLGRSPSHRKAMFKNLASALFLTERDAELDPNPPKVKGRVVTTVPKAKEIRPLVEKCITIACKALKHIDEAKQFGTDAERNSDAWKQWRKSEQWHKWANAMAPAVAARRRLVQLLGDKQAVSVLMSEVAPRFRDRRGGYTRIVRLAKPRLGDAGARAIIEFVGVRDREVQKSQKPSFSDESTSTENA